MGLFIGYRHSIADAFGNALGNSIVSGIQSSETEKNNRNRYIEAMGQKLTADTAHKIDSQLATDLNNSLNITMQGVDASVDRMLWAINRNQGVDGGSAFATSENNRVARQQGVVDHGSYQSALTHAKIQSFNQQHAANSHHRVMKREQYRTQLQNRLDTGNMQARVGFDALKPTGVDLGKAYNWDEAIAFERAAWANGRSNANSLRGGINVMGDATKRSFEAYGNAFKKIYHGYDAMLDRVNGFNGNNPASIAFGGSAGGQLLRMAGSYDVSFAYDSSGQFAMNFAGWSAGAASANGLAFDANLLMSEKAFTSSAINHVTGYQHTTALDVELSKDILDKIGASSSLKDFVRNKPIDIYAGAIGGQLQDKLPTGFSKFSDTQGYRLGASTGIKFNGTGPFLVTDSLSFSPIKTSFSVNTGIFGKTIYAFNNFLYGNK